ncbi:MAG: HlyD family type I secretion periplasmic adaptor subunit [Phormidesmis sp. RL_2_1]|nr:HlyD family type I secretion periplasmic adaptor subunit [Phormidesmis sp. RL_2_1]
MTLLPKAPPKAVQLRRNKHDFSTAQDYLNADLARAVRRAPPKYSRLLSGGVCVVVASLIAWAALSKVDEVATAQAEVIPSSRVQPMKALAGGLIEDIKVEEGQQVKAGQPLVELDPTLSEAEFQRLKQQVTLTESTLTRLEAERTGRSSSGNPLQNQLIASRLQQFQAQQQIANAEANRQLGVMKAAQAELERLEATLTVASNKRDSFAKLAAVGAAPRLDYLDAESETVSLQKQAAAQQQVIYQSEQAYAGAKAEAARLSADRQNEILTQIEQQQKELESLRGQLSQAEEQRRRETITAAVDGTVYNVKVVEAGANVQAGEELLSLLPQGAPLVVEAKVLGRDERFVRPGMPVKIKLESFDYQEFGLLEGTVERVSPNAIDDPEARLVYPTRIRLEKPSITIQGKEVALTPGMPATADIVIRERTILRFLLNPIIEKWDQTFSAR